jgi:hypothetical protein
MHTLPEFHRIRLYLKYLHIMSSCLWLGAGFSVMVLLHLGRLAGSGDALSAFNVAIRHLDNFLIIPSAASSFLSGVALCQVANLGLTSCRWVVTKWTVTVVAMVFGALCLAPWMSQLAVLSEALGFIALADPGYFHTYYLDVIFGALQTIILLYLMLISVLKPCSGYRNCVHCREHDARLDEPAR